MAKSVSRSVSRNAEPTNKELELHQAKLADVLGRLERRILANKQGTAVGAPEYIDFEIPTGTLAFKMSKQWGSQTIFGIHIEAGSNGQISFNNGTAAVGIILYDDSDDSFYFYTNAVARMRLDATGQLGIGANPARKLQVSADSGTVPADPGSTVALVNNNSAAGDDCAAAIVAGTTGNASLHFGDSADEDAGKVDYDNNDDSLSLWTNAAKRVTVDNAGNVGVGTASPSFALEVDKGSVSTNVKISGDGAGLLIEDQNGGVDQKVIQTLVNNNKWTLRGLNDAISAQTFKMLEFDLSNGKVEAPQAVKVNGMTFHGNLASAPSSPAAGDVYYDTATNKHRGYDGTSWNNFY